MDSASKIKIISANVVGLNNFEKASGILLHLEKKHPDIIAFCDTRLDERSERSFLNTFDKYYGYFSNLNSQSRGVCILIKKKIAH